MDYPYGVYIPGRGPRWPTIVCVGEAPFTEEVKELQPFVGPSGRFLNSIFYDVGIDRSSIWITNACKYMVPPSPKGDKPIPFFKRAESVGIDLQQQYTELRDEILQLQPNIIIALGGTALYALTGKKKIEDWRGSIISAHGIKLIATYHPAHILYSEGEVKGYWNKQVMIHDLKRAYEQSKFKDIKLPVRNLHIARSSADLYDFQRRNVGQTRPAHDIEANKCIPHVFGFSFSPREGIAFSLWDDTIPIAERAQMWNIADQLLSTNEVVGQNYGYDRDKIARLGFTIKKLASDVMLKSFAINPELPKNLAFNTSIYTEEPFYKNEGMYEGSSEDLLLGCARDACVTKEIDLLMDADIDKLGVRDYYERFLLPLHNIYHFDPDFSAIEQIGFKVDESIRRALLTKYIEWDEQVRYELFKIAGEFVNTSSPPQVSKLLYDKWHLPIRKGTGEEVLTSLINSPSVKNELYKKGMGLILEDRRVKKTISQYLYALPDYDGRMRTSFYLCLETGRSATQQQEAPIRPNEEYKQIDEYGKRVKKRQSRGAAFQTMTKHGEIGPEIRTMYVADEGHVFLQADSSQAEARVIFLLAEDYQALKDIDEHDYHALTASWFFGGTENDYSKKTLGYESPIRFAGKTLRHAGHLGASKRRASIELNTQARKYKIDFQISEAQADRALKIFHAKQPKIKGVFQDGVIKCISKDRRLIAPVPSGIKASIGGIRTFFERYDDELFRQAFSYLPQRTVSENTKAAALRIRGSREFNIPARARWIKILCEAHDALLCMVPLEREQEAALILKEELERSIDFSACSLPRGELIIPCEIERGFNYYDLKKFRFLVETT